VQASFERAVFCATRRNASHEAEGGRQVLGGTGGLALPEREIELSGPADPAGVEAPTMFVDQAETTIGSLGLLE
jgi:hypothetical protein